MSDGTYVTVRVLFPGPGSGDLARHIRQRLDDAVVGALVDGLSDSERAGVRVSTEIAEDD